MKHAHKMAQSQEVDLGLKIAKNATTSVFSAATRKTVIQAIISEMAKSRRADLGRLNSNQLIIWISEVLDGSGCLRANANYLISVYLTAHQKKKHVPSIPQIEHVRCWLNG
jgi:hypothetical protein